jgi:putative ATP-dependent endonuclease of the OLD family
MAAELLHLNKKDWDGIRLGLVEELEAHLHPQAQMQVVESLQNQKNVQLILSTHSPNLASKVLVENLILCNDNYAFPLGIEYTKLEESDYSFLQRFLDVTKSNLFFAKGVILVEGWSEEILIPTLAKKMKSLGLIDKDLTEAGVSIVNVGSTALLNYAKIFLRKEEPYLNIPIAIVNDVDIRTYQRISIPDVTTGKLIDDFEKLDENDVKKKSFDKMLNSFKDYNDQNVLSFITPIWTLEYTLFKSDAIGEIFKEVTKAIHNGTDWETDFEKELAKKLIKKSLNKVEIAYRLAEHIEKDIKKETPVLNFKPNDTISYLLDAITYACKN